MVATRRRSAREAEPVSVHEEVQTVKRRRKLDGDDCGEADAIRIIEDAMREEVGDTTAAAESDKPLKETVDAIAVAEEQSGDNGNDDTDDRGYSDDGTAYTANSATTGSDSNHDDEESSGDNDDNEIDDESFHLLDNTPHIPCHPALNVPFTDERARTSVTQIVADQLALERQLKRTELAIVDRELAVGRGWMAYQRRRALYDQRLREQQRKREAAAVARGQTFLASNYGLRKGVRREDDLPTVEELLLMHQGTASSRNHLGVFAQMENGQFVRLTCPFCHRHDFANRVGFVNHCRASHNFQLSSTDEWNRRCGQPVSENMVPLNDPSRRERNVTAFTEFDARMQVQEDDERAGDQPTIKIFGEEEEQKSFENVNTNGSNAVVPLMDSVVTDARNLVEPPSTPDETATPTHCQTSGLPFTPLGLPTIHAPASAGSRFYTKRRILVGNVSRYLPVEKRAATGNSRVTHKWMVYLRAGDTESEDLSSFIRCVRFYLHPSYRPNDVVDVITPPYQLVRYGWGEFPIRVRVMFHDEEVNRAVDVIHALGLDGTGTGRQVQGPQRAFDIELDRRSSFVKEGEVFNGREEAFAEGQDRVGETSREDQVATMRKDDVEKMEPPTVYPLDEPEAKLGDNTERNLAGPYDPSTVKSTADDTLPISLSTTVNNGDGAVISTTPTDTTIFCKYCGAIEHFGSTRKLCPFRPPYKRDTKRAAMNTLSTVETLFRRLQEPAGGASKDEDDVDHHMVGDYDIWGGNDEDHEKEHDDGDKFSFERLPPRTLLRMIEPLPSADTLYPLPATAALSFIQRTLRPLPLPSFSAIQRANFTRETFQLERSALADETAIVPSEDVVSEETIAASSLFIAARMFLRHLIARSVAVHRMEDIAMGHGDSSPRVTSESAPPCNKLLTPFHVARALYLDRSRGWDLFTNDYLEAPPDSSEVDTGAEVEVEADSGGEHEVGNGDGDDMAVTATTMQGGPVVGSKSVTSERRLEEDNARGFDDMF